MAAEPELHYTLKVASRCNLNCTYCYVYNKGDSSWRNRPAVMSDETIAAAVARIARHSALTSQRTVRIVFHGGEPCLVGADRMRRWCDSIVRTLHPHVRVRFAIQTNGTLIDDEWCSLLYDYSFTVGISLDGPASVHDAQRVDHAGRGSYAAVTDGMRRLQNWQVPVGLLAVLQFGADSVAIHRHLCQLLPVSIDYILPDFTHDTVGAVYDRYGQTPCADYLIPVFDDWWFNGTLELSVGPFREITRILLGGDSRIDLFGNRPFGFVFVETDGAIQGLDVLRICNTTDVVTTSLNVQEHDFAALAAASEIQLRTVFSELPLPKLCHACDERSTCAGGYLPHRYSSERAFDNPSVWCADILALFRHIRMRLNVSTDETSMRRDVLHSMARQSQVHTR